MSAEATATFQRPAQNWLHVPSTLSAAKDASRTDAAVIRATVHRREVEFLGSMGVLVAIPLPQVLALQPRFWLGVCRCAERLGLLSYLPLWTRLRYRFVKLFMGSR